LAIGSLRQAASVYVERSTRVANDALIAPWKKQIPEGPGVISVASRILDSIGFCFHARERSSDPSLPAARAVDSNIEAVDGEEN